LSILLASQELGQGSPESVGQVTGPARAAELLDYLRSSGRMLTYDPQHRILRTDAEDAVAVTIGRGH